MSKVNDTGHVKGRLRPLRGLCCFGSMYVRPPLHACQCDKYHTSLQHTSLILDIHVLIN